MSYNKINKINIIYIYIYNLGRSFRLFAELTTYICVCVFCGCACVCEGVRVCVRVCVCNIQFISKWLDYAVTNDISILDLFLRRIQKQL